MKDEVRSKLKFKRRCFGGAPRADADANIFEFFKNAYSGYTHYFIYNSFGSEADTLQIIFWLLKAGKSVYLPRVEGENIVPVPYGSFKTGAFGISEPQGQAYKGKIDVTVTPLLAVNPKGFRIGYGKGFYDRYFNCGESLKIGLGYYFQIEDFSEDEWDVALDEFVCERGIIKFGNSINGGRKT